MRRFLRLLRAASTASLVGAAVIAMVAPFAQAQELRTQQDDFTGYKAEAFAAPISIQLYEQLVPIPVDPGKPHMEISANFANATLNTGPLGLARGATTWPGDGIGGGLGQLACDESVIWPIMALATFPSEPHTAEAEPGMTAAALGLLSEAEAAGGGELVPGLVRSKQGRGWSLGTITEEGQSVARAVAVPGQVTLFDGLVLIDGFRTVVEATSDGVDSSVSGAQEAGRITIAGTVYTVDNTGIRREDPEDSEEEQGLVPGLIDELPFGLGTDVDLQDLLGVQVQTIADETSVEGNQASRTIGGVRILLNTARVKDLLDLALDPVQEALAGIVREFPDDPEPEEGQCGGMGPKAALELAVASLDFRSTIGIIIGRAGVTVNAVRPPELPEPPAPPPLPPPPTVDVPGTSVPPPSSVPPGGANPPSVEPPTTQPPAPSVGAPEQPARTFFNGIPWGAAVAALAIFGLMGRGLHFLTVSAFGADASALSLRKG